MNGRADFRDQFACPLIAGLTGNPLIAKNMTFSKDVVVVDWGFEANHNGPFAGRGATGTAVFTSKQSS